MLNKHDLEKPRSIVKAVEFVQSLRKNSDREERKKIRSKKGLYRKYLQEYLPLLFYSLNNYGIVDDIKIKANLNNDNYDGFILDIENIEIERIEITYPIDGEKESSDAKQLNEKGITDIEDFGDEKREKNLNNVLRVANEKSLKDYSLSTLVITINAYHYLSLNEVEDMLRIYRFVEQLKSITYNAKKVVLLILPISSSTLKTMGLLFTIKD